MFDFAWSEIALIGVVALIFIGPKDLPIAVKAVAGVVKKARRMAGEFQTHLDEMVKDADLREVRDSIHEIRSFDWKGKLERAVDTDGSLRAGFAAPLADGAIHVPPSPAPAADAPAFIPPAESLAHPPPSPAPMAPAFIPPAFIPPAAAAAVTGPTVPGPSDAAHG